MTKLDHADRLCRAGNRRLRQLRSMGIAGGFARDGAQTEALGRIIRGRLQAAIVKGKAFSLAVFQEQLAVVRAVQGVIHKRLDTAPVHSGLGEKQVFVAGHGGAREGEDRYIVMAQRSVIHAPSAMRGIRSQ